ncbi:hypothetical protein EXS45_01610 [Candidatus Nomurabacteria bacterium]|nr:hypothetical protein [Candidatus Nomurabacteria bacterium]
MIDSIEWLRIFIFDYPSLQYLTIFLGAALGGEIAIFTLSFLSAQGILSPVALVMFSFLGTLSSDSFWFLLGKTNTAQKIISHRYAHSAVSTIAEVVRRVSRGSHLLALIFAKFLVGTRIVMLLYISKTEFLFNQFICYNAVATLLWLLVVVPIGFFSGLGFTYVAEIFHNLYAGVGFIFLVLIIIVLVQLWLKKIFIRMRNQ